MSLKGRLGLAGNCVSHLDDADRFCSFPPPTDIDEGRTGIGCYPKVFQEMPHKKSEQRRGSE